MWTHTSSCKVDLRTCASLICVGFSVGRRDEPLSKFPEACECSRPCVRDRKRYIETILRAQTLMMASKKAVRLGSTVRVAFTVTIEIACQAENCQHLGVLPSHASLRLQHRYDVWASGKELSGRTGIYQSVGNKVEAPRAVPFQEDVWGRDRCDEDSRRLGKRLAARQTQSRSSPMSLVSAIRGRNDRHGVEGVKAFLPQATGQEDGGENGRGPRRHRNVLPIHFPDSSIGTALFREL